MTAKELKAEYDRNYRLLNKEKLQQKAREYNQSKAGREMQKRQRQKNKESGYHNAFCRKPEQREKERQRRYIRLNQLENKFCIVCETNKPKIDFTASRIYEDGRMYLCKQCDKLHEKEFGVTTKSVIQVVVTGCDYKLSREDVAKYPYFIEAKKYSIILNKLIK